MMKRTNYDIMKGALFHVLNFMMVELLRQGFIVAMEDELSDLKGLVCVEGPRWLCDDGFEDDLKDDAEVEGTTDGLISAEAEYELLDELNNEVVKQIMLTVKRLVAFRDRHLMLTGLDLEELILDEQCYLDAAEAFYNYLDDFTPAVKYSDQMFKLDMVYIEFFTLLYYCAGKFTTPDADVYEFMEDIAEENSIRFWEGILDTEDQNALRILELHQELQDDYKAINNLIF